MASAAVELTEPVDPSSSATARPSGTGPTPTVLITTRAVLARIRQYALSRAEVQGQGDDGQVLDLLDLLEVREKRNFMTVDEEALLAQLGKGRLVLTAENHSVVGGLFDTVARTVVAHGLGEKITPIALPDDFLEAGALPTLNDRYGVSAEKIVERVRGLL